MGKKDPRVDAYIAKSADFAQPILNHLRKVVHAGCPEVEETLKWSAPHFMYKGMLAGMASFKSHCAFGFWKGTVLAEKLGGDLTPTGEAAMGQFGRITSLSDLPDETTLIRYVREAAALNEQGVKAKPRPKSERKAEVEVPNALRDALAKNKKAKATFEGFSPSHKREYVEWVTEAKTETTRKRRLDQAVEWMAEGKVRNWKYVRE